MVKTVPVERSRHASAQNASVKTASAVRVVPVERGRLVSAQSASVRTASAVNLVASV